MKQPNPDAFHHLAQEECSMRPPMLDPARDLAGATPETLARALFRRVEPLRPRPGGESVVGDQLPVRERAAHEPGDDISHLVEGAPARAREFLPLGV